MDAFFTIASAIPVSVEEPVESVPIDADAVGTNGTHGSCIVA
ncbi:pheromone precursor [Trametes coccinea BRFM310]|uniref:Pheromone n=1 Tax=Trametes coccinea (strain BRFM310) TaxID=1353009 RepID=A0A1Y2IUK7_TRAC3|nr:pheromone precursor [Trametes coccinea BRFM310]